jgi:hypothetical protein
MTAPTDSTAIASISFHTPLPASRRYDLSFPCLIHAVTIYKWMSTNLEASTVFEQHVDAYTQWEEAMYVM